jgi:FKBP-type peptidyl-prolyl cis-trans isomerase SlyD
MTERVIAFHYKLTDDTGTEIDSSEGQNPLAFITGMNHIIPGLESQIIELKEGDKQTVNVKAEEAYGPKHDDLTQAVPREQFPEDVTIEVGMVFTAEEQMVTVVAVSDTEVTVDANHPLAGKDLSFAVEIVTIRDAEAAEIESGQVQEEGGCGTGCGHDHH